MLALLTMTAVRALLRTCATSTSIPTQNMNRQTPIWLISLSVPRESAANTNRKGSGAIKPNSDGPKRIPATISPTTAGCPHLTKAMPTIRETAMITSNWRNRRLKGSLPFRLKLASAVSITEPSDGLAVAVAMEAAAPAAGAGEGSEAPRCNRPMMPNPNVTTTRK